MKAKKKINYIWFAPIITLGILLILYAVAGIFPFGKFSTAFSDGINQYVPMLAEFSRKIKEGGSLLYTWHTGGGTNFWVNFAYYLASPLNLISLFFKPTQMDRAFSLITLLKPVLMSLTFEIYLKHRYKKNDISVVIFSVLWAFSGFMISSFFIASWYDAIIYFPLVILGLQRMMDGKSAWLYSLFLGLTILSNFYIGWMVCIFCVIYFIYCFVSDEDVVYEGVTAPKDDSEAEPQEKEDRVNIFAVFKNSYILGNLFKFAFSSLLAGALSAVFTLPTVFSLQNTGKGIIEPRTITFNDIWGILASHIYPMGNNYSTLTSVNVLFCFAGILTLVLCTAYFFSRGISVRKKVGNLFLLVCMWGSIVFYAVYFVWHGFSEPAGLMYRFAFIYSFVLIKIAYEMFTEIERTSVLGVLLGVGFVGVCMFGLYKNLVTNTYFWSARTAVTLIVFALVFACIIIAMKKDVKMRKALALILTVVIALESFVLNIGHINKTDMTEVFTGQETVSKLLADSGKKDYDVVSLTNKPNGFYEMVTYGLAYGYRGMEIYSSMADGDFVLTASDMGAYGNRLNSENGATETTPIFNLLFPTKYVVDGSGRLTPNEFRKKTAEKDGYTLFENNYTMPFMYMLSGNIGLWRPFSFPVVVDNINEFFKCATDTDKNVAVYNANSDFSFENCEQIKTVDKIANESEHGHEHNVNDGFWNYLENRMVNFSYRIDDLSKSAYITYKSVAEADGIMYIFVDTTEFVDMEITLNGKTTDYYTYGNGENCTYEIGEVKKGDVAEITIGGRKANVDGTYSEYAKKESSFAAVGFTVDMDIFREGYEKLDTMSDTQMLEFFDTKVKAKVTAHEDGALYIPIVFDKGWKITVDGVPTEIYEHESHIMMLAMAKGEHVVEMKYCPQGFVTGAVITGISMLVLIAWAVILKKRNDKLTVCDTIEENADKE